jgi:hypothetical protein
VAGSDDVHASLRPEVGMVSAAIALGLMERHKRLAVPATDDLGGAGIAGPATLLPQVRLAGDLASKTTNFLVHFSPLILCS